MAENYRYQWKAERLMEDFQALRLHGSSWSDVQAVMSRWGHYGRYTGTCDANRCVYDVVLRSPLETLLGSSAYWERAAFYPFLLGNRGTLWTSFVVRHGVVIRKRAVFIYGGAHWRDGVALIASSSATSPLANDPSWPVRSSQLIEHPNYLVTHPGGCSFCLMAQVYFTPDTPTDEVRRLSTFNLACMTRWLGCQYLEDIYPAAEAWHLYDGTFGGRPASTQKRAEWVPPVSCATPLSVRGREAQQVLLVTSLHEEQALSVVDEGIAGQQWMVESTRVRIDQVLKGNAGYQPGTLMDVKAMGLQWSPKTIEVPLLPGKQYVLMSAYSTRESPVVVEYCGAVAANTESLAEIDHGIKTDDGYGNREAYESWFPPF